MAIYNALADSGSFLYIPMAQVPGGYIIIPRNEVKWLGDFQTSRVSGGVIVPFSPQEIIQKAEQSGANLLGKHVSKKCQTKKRFYYGPYIDEREERLYDEVDFKLKPRQTWAMEAISPNKGLAELAVLFKVTDLGLLHILEEKAIKFE